MSRMQREDMKPVRAEISRVQANLGPSLVAQLVKNLPAMQETPVQFLGWEDLLEKQAVLKNGI